MAGSFFDDDFDKEPQQATAPVGPTPPAQPVQPQATAPSAPLPPKPAAPPKPPGITAEQRRQRALDWERGLDYGQGRGRREIEEGDQFYNAAVLGDELSGGHFDPLDNNWAYSFSGAGPEGSGGAWRFKDRSGRETSGTPEQIAAARADMERWVDAGGNPVSGGGGGSAGAGGGGGAGQLSFEEQLEELLRGGLTGGRSRYNTDVVASMKAAAGEDAAGAVSAQNRALQRAAARKGLTYSGSTEAEAAENRRVGSRTAASANRKIDVDKATADFEDQMQMADRALALIDQRRQERIAQAKNATDIRRIEAEAKAASDKIKAEAAIAQKGYDAERASGRANRDWQDANAQRDREWAVEDARRREALELARLGLGG